MEDCADTLTREACQAVAYLWLVRAYDPDQERDEAGRWTAGGGGGGEGGEHGGGQAAGTLTPAERALRDEPVKDRKPLHWAIGAKGLNTSMMYTLANGQKAVFKPAELDRQPGAGPGGGLTNATANPETEGKPGGFHAALHER